LLAPYREVMAMNDRMNETGISEKKTVSFASFIGVDLHKCSVTILQSIPGIAEIWNCIIAAEVGPFGSCFGFFSFDMMEIPLPSVYIIYML